MACAPPWRACSSASMDTTTLCLLWRRSGQAQHAQQARQLCGMRAHSGGWSMQLSLPSQSTLPCPQPLPHCLTDRAGPGAGLRGAPACCFDWPSQPARLPARKQSLRLPCLLSSQASQLAPPLPNTSFPPVPLHTGRCAPTALPSSRRRRPRTGPTCGGQRVFLLHVHPLPAAASARRRRAPGAPRAARAALAGP